MALTAVMPLAGCTAMLAHTLLFAIQQADSSIVHDVYEARVVVYLHLGDKLITATRYAKIGWREGTFANRTTGCQSPEPRCWVITDHYFIGLPDGAIADVFVGQPGVSGQGIAGLKPGDTVLGEGKLTAIFADQPDLKLARELGSCQPYGKVDMAAHYNLPIGTSSNTTFWTASYAVPVAVTRLNEQERAGAVVSPNSFYDAKIFDKASCHSLLRDASRNTFSSSAVP